MVYEGPNTFYQQEDMLCKWVASTLEIVEYLNLEYITLLSQVY